MIKRAERPITVSFIEGSSCTFDSNDFVEFEILTPDLPMGEIVFKGSPFTDEGYTEIGRCVFDYCDHGLYVYQELANMLYEAQHPWLDWRDFLDKEIKDTIQIRTLDEDELEWDAEWWYSNDDTYELDLDRRYLQENGYRYSTKSVAFKPKTQEGWYACANVKVYTP